jgi:predicted GIY-YIG superfamily endonuclease
VSQDDQQSTTSSNGKTRLTKKMSVSTARYNLHRLVYYLAGDSIQGAVEREKEMKRWSRQHKIDAINTMNPQWKDLSEYIGVTRNVLDAVRMMHRPSP